MTGRTHATLGLAVGLLVSAFTRADPLYSAALGVIGGLLPDIDHPQSIISGWIPGSNIILSLGHVRHRGFTHSLLFIVLLIAGWLALTTRIPIPYNQLISCLVGVVSHLLADMLTPQGIQLLYPLKGNWKAAPGFVLGAGKWLGVTEFVVWLAGLAGIGAGLFLLVKGIHL